MSKLIDIVKEHYDSINGRTVLVVKDTDGHMSALYRSDDRIAQHFQDGYCPVVGPVEMDYKAIDFMDFREALRTVLKGEENTESK